VKVFAADLHVHTALSPCASEEMTPPAICRAALDAGLAMIGVCDHNSAGNVAAVQAAAAMLPGEELAVIAGIEITTVEEVHVAGLFPDAAAACGAAREAQESLPEVDGRDSRFGEQRLMDPEGAIIGAERKVLHMACALDLNACVALIKRYGGLAIAAHINRPSYSVISQLGVFPADAGFDAVEFAPMPYAPALGFDLKDLGLPVLESSDGHYLSDIGSRFCGLEMAEPSFEELVLAIRRSGGRRVRNA